MAKVAKCPNDNSHKRFSVTAHVTQNWKVDEKGNFLETIEECVEVTHTPNSEDVWTCLTCGAEAIFL